MLLEKLEKWKRGMEMKGLRVNAGMTKVMRCRVSKGQVEVSGRVCSNSIFAWSVTVGFIKSVVASQGSYRITIYLNIYLKIYLNIYLHCKRCLEGSPDQSINFAERG